MNAHIPALPAGLPSRAKSLAEAHRALATKSTVLITGAPGSGRTTFGQMLLAARAHKGRHVHRITGSKTLAEVPYGALAAISAQIPGLITPDVSALDSIRSVAAKSTATPRTFFIDQAEDVDEASAAVIAQLLPSVSGANVELIVATSNLASLPSDLRQLAYENDACHVELQPLKIDDARVLIEDITKGPCNASTVNRLFNLSGANPMFLRELVIDAVQKGALPQIHGYRTLTSSWEPSGRRIVDLVTARLAEQQPKVREAVDIIAITGPLQRASTVKLITPVTLDEAIEAGLLSVSAQNTAKDIAQIFDGPGAKQMLEHPEEMVQLGAGLSSSLILATINLSSLEGYFAQITAEIPDALLTEATRLHLRAVYDPQSEFSQPATTQTVTNELEVYAGQIVELTHRGQPGEGVAIFAEHVDGPIWHASDSAAQTLFIQAMFLAMIGEGSRLDVFDEHFTSIDWHDVSLDHGVFLTGRGDLFLEVGDAGEAANLLAQALGLLSMHDRTGIMGFAAGLDAVAATLLGDLERARMRYAQFISAPKTSGGLARAEAERLMLLVLRTLEGPDAAFREYKKLLAQAETAGQSFIQMRLLHDAWRLKLIAPEAISAHLTQLKNVAERVQGPFAALLARYAAAFRNLITDPQTVNEIINGHLEAGRPLFAAEVAARAAEIAAQTVDRRLAASMFALFAEITPALSGVNTPSLGRARIDPEVLSEREEEVCMLALEGKTNPEIAAELFLSPRTVEGHLQRSYSKLGITDRRQLLAPFAKGEQHQGL